MFPSLLTLPPSSIEVLDAEEEVFNLYSSRFSSTLGSAGLGSYDSLHDEISVRIDLRASPPKGLLETPSRTPKLKSRSENRQMHVCLKQDITSLRTRRGDTGSVLWRASIELARVILSDCYCPVVEGSRSFINPTKFREARVLELGSGIGLLGCLFAPLVKHYIVTDLPEMLPLIQKNMDENVTKTDSNPPQTRAHRSKNRQSLDAQVPSAPNYSIAALDWTDVATSAPSSTARKLVRTSVLGSPSEHIDLIIAVDTLYNTSLVSPFLATLEEFANGPSTKAEGGVRESTAVLVVCELRDEDVIRVFLEGWLSLGGWKVWRVGDHASPDARDTNNVTLGYGIPSEAFFDGPFVAWLGWKA